MNLKSRHLKPITLLYTLLITLIIPSPVYAQWADQNDLCVSDGDVATIIGIECLVENIFTAILSLIGIGAFVMVIVSAFKLLTSGGDPQKAGSAKTTLGYAFAGLGLALGAWFILQFVSTFAFQNRRQLLEFHIFNP